MSVVSSLFTAPWETLLCCLLLIVSTAVASPRHRRWHLPSLIVSLVVALLASSGVVAFAALAVATLVHAWSASSDADVAMGEPTRGRRTGAVMLIVAALLTLGIAGALAADRVPLAFGLSCAVLALRSGLPPLHLGVANLCERAPVVQTQQLASLIALVFLHLRFVDHHAVAIAAGPWLVRYGAATALLAALVTLVQTDVRGFFRGTTGMHAGMLFASIGAASIGNFAAALLVAITMGLALGGLGMMITSLETRVGAVSLAGPGGRIGAFPKLSAAFVLFAGAGVAVPGMAGFVADDLLLHTLWMESPTSTVAMILASAFLAVGSLFAFSRVFLGRTTPSRAPDLYPRERAVAAVLLLLLVVLGIAPGLVLTPAHQLLSVIP